jgi:hypothetical protein
MESTTGLYKTELIKPRRPWRSLAQVELATAEWVDWYNHQRLHSALNYLPPAEYESMFYASIDPITQRRLSTTAESGPVRDARRGLGRRGRRRARLGWKTGRTVTVVIGVGETIETVAPPTHRYCVHLESSPATINRWLAEWPRPTTPGRAALEIRPE